MSAWIGEGRVHSAPLKVRMVHRQLYRESGTPRLDPSGRWDRRDLPILELRSIWSTGGLHKLETNKGSWDEQKANSDSSARYRRASSIRSATWFILSACNLGGS